MLYRRGKRWWVRFTVRGREVRLSSGTDSRSLAEEFEQKLRERIWRGQQLGQHTYFWEEAKERWLKDKAGKRSLRRDRQAFNALEDHVGGKALVDLNEDTWRDVGEALAQSRKPGTVARILSLAKSVTRAAVAWRWIASAPKIQIPASQKGEPRWITRDQFESLCAELPQHAATLARFAVATGLRSRNVFRLAWTDVDLEQKTLRVAAGNTKGGKSIGVPLSNGAVQTLNGQLGKHPEYVFTDHRGRAPVTSIKTCWLKATERAGLKGFRFHDLRHTWAAWHTLAGTPPIILKELGGWASLAMVERYAHLNPGHLAEWAENSGTKSAQSKAK